MEESKLFKLDEILTSEFETPRINKNSFSYWFKEIKDIKSLKIPETLIIKVPERIRELLYEPCGNEEEIEAWLKEKVLPEIKKNRVFCPYFFY